MVKVTELIKEKAEPMIDIIYQDDFIQGIIRGDLKKEAVVHYLRADYLYLKSFADVYAILLAKSSSIELKQFFFEQIDFVLNGEVEAHKILAKYVGEDYEKIVSGGEWYPAADHYIKHMYYNAYARSFAETIAAMAPCPWVYMRLAEKILENHTLGEDNPFKGWVEFYAEPFIKDLMVKLDELVDKEADYADKNIKKRIVKNFLESCEHERNFFKMAYDEQKWGLEL